VSGPLQKPFYCGISMGDISQLGPFTISGRIRTHCLSGYTRIDCIYVRAATLFFLILGFGAVWYCWHQFLPDYLISESRVESKLSIVRMHSKSLSCGTYKMA